MNNKAFISIEYLFSIFIILIIATGLLYFAQAGIQSAKDIEDNTAHRLILDNISNQISQVNSNGEGYSKHITLPKISYYKIIVDKNSLTIEYDNKKGDSLITLLDIDSKYELISGRSYWIEKDENGKIVIK